MKIKLLILFCFIANFSFAQWQKPNNAYGTISNRGNFKNVLILPTGCGMPSLNAADSAQNGYAIYGDSCNDKVYFYNPSTKIWKAITGGGGISQSQLNDSTNAIRNDFPSGSTVSIDSIYISSSSTTDSIFYNKSGIKTLIGVIDTKDGLINGGIVTWNSGLTFDVTAALYKLNGVRYNSNAGSVTLDAASAQDRVDAIAVDTLNNIIVIKGTPSNTPANPQIDPSLGIILTYVTIKSGATTPAGVSSSTIYDENVEWTTSSTFTANFNNTTSVFRGTKSIDVSVGSAGNYLQFTNSAVLNSTDYTTLKYYINLKGAINKRSSLSAQFFNGATAVSNLVQLSSANGFDKNIVAGYQNISMQLSSFSFSSSSFDRVRISFSGTSFPGMYVDYITLQAGVTSGGGGGTTGNHVLNVWTVRDTTYQLKDDGQTTIVREPVFDVTYFKSPIYNDNDTTKLKVDSMPRMSYNPISRDTSTWLAKNALTDVQYLNDRLNGFSPSGGTGSNNPDSLAGKPGSYYAPVSSVPTNNNILTNGAGYITTVPAQSWTSITGKPTFSTVATSGSYNDLTNKPTITTGITQVYTGSSSVTIDNATTWLIINPTTTSSTTTITLPASPSDMQKIEISFGGTIAGGNGVVLNLTVSPNTGQTIIQSSSPSYIQSGETISYRYNISNTSYYRIN